MSFNSTSIDQCGNSLWLELPDCKDEMCCTARFEANPDASGIGIVVAFVANGLINVIVATFLWYLKQFRRRNGEKNEFEKWTQALCDFLAQASLFPGITLLVAAFSQYKTISSFHFYITVVVADLSTSGRVVVLINVLLGKDRITKIQGAVAFIFQALFLCSLVEVIRRMSGDNWRNEPGMCFAMYHGGYKSLQERDYIRGWVISQLVVWFYWHMICPLQLHYGRHLVARIPRHVRVWASAILYVIPDTFLWIWSLYLVASAMVGNKERIIGDEWILGFGQVAALVALFTVCYAIFLSYEAYRMACKRRRLGDDTEVAESQEKFFVV